MERARAMRLPDGRLHLQHGPIDIVADAEGAGREEAFERAARRFASILPDLADELPALRTDAARGVPLRGAVARAMADAVRPFVPTYVTPMAAVAGAVADAICAELAGAGVVKAYANNGGDVAIFLSPGAETVAAVAAPVLAQVRIGYDSPVRGVATSGWRGRSHSLGIADSVTVLGQSAAEADVAATLIANAVDLPGDPRIHRRPARELAPDSDLGDLPVTCEVPALNAADIARALGAGRRAAQSYRQRGLIVAALLVLQNEVVSVGDLIRAQLT